MWLLDLRKPSFSLTWLSEASLTPPEATHKYAILSHRWAAENEELTFAEVNEDSRTRKKSGWQKVKRFCRQARSDGYDFAWCDTCCIDKKSSAELQESINSMYRWYQRADVCYVHLSDVSVTETRFREHFANSEWFSRGWTLQELIAPSNVVFFDSDWQLIGSKIDLASRLAAITRINIDVLTSTKTCMDFSIAQRMSWASYRQTSRSEDIAYCLMGLFDVNMPMLYGEGDKAFRRLQEEIIKDSSDQSIFAWTGITPLYPGLLAPGPKNFGSANNIRNVQGFRPDGSYHMTNLGLSIPLTLVPYYTGIYLAMIESVSETGREEGSAPVAIFLQIIENEQYARISFMGHDIVENMGQSRAVPAFDKRVTVRQRTFQTEEYYDLFREILRVKVYGFRLAEDLPISNDVPGAGTSPGSITVRKGDWEPKSRLVTMVAGSDYRAIALLDMSAYCREWSAIRLGFDQDFNPFVIAFDTSRNWDYFQPLEDYEWQTKDVLRSSERRFYFFGQAHGDLMHDGACALKGNREFGLDFYVQLDSSTWNFTIRLGSNEDLRLWDFKMSSSPSNKTTLFPSYRLRSQLANVEQ